MVVEKFNFLLRSSFDGATQSVNFNASPSNQTNYLTVIVSCVTCILTMLTIFITWYNVRNQIASTEKNILTQKLLLEADNFRNLMTKLLYELSKPDNGTLSRNKHVSEDHLFIEKGLLILLNRDSPQEKALIDCIKKFEHTTDLDKKNWVEELETLAQKVIKSKFNLS